MTVQFTKGRSGKPDTLACSLEDGSHIWAPLHLATHDLGHYAFETEAGWRDAFFGLLAQGWAVADFAARDPETNRRRAVPIQALQAEILVGLLDLERPPTSPPVYAEFVAMLTSVCAGLDVPAPAISPDLLQAVRVRRAGLLLRWEQVSPGERLTLSF